MADTIIDQGPGYTIALSDVAATLVPYEGCERPTGDVNHGWIDLKDRPDLVDSIPEARKSEGLAEILRVMAAPSSRVLSTACECAAFDDSDRESAVRWQAGGFVIAVFRDDEQNTAPQNFIDLARYILQGIQPSDRHVFGFELIVEPLKAYFGRTDCFDLMIKPLGYGASEAAAWAAFDHAAHAVAAAIKRDRPVIGD